MLFFSSPEASIDQDQGSLDATPIQTITSASSCRDLVPFLPEPVLQVNIPFQRLTVPTRKPVLFSFKSLIFSEVSAPQLSIPQTGIEPLKFWFEMAAKLFCLDPSFRP
jgi:hypothetical protein